MKFSFIVGTLNRTEALWLCIDSLLKQTIQDFEIIIIDQSDDSSTAALIKKINDDRIIYKKVNVKGLSKARNTALDLATGEFFCLIDDDANYDSRYLEVAEKHITPNTILTGYIYDTVKNEDFANYNGKNDKKYLSTREVFRTCPSAGLIIPMKVAQKVGRFDEMFGVGGKYGAGEETDLLLRAKAKGFKIKYIKEMKLKHPIPAIKKPFDICKSEKYYEGTGALISKHKNEISVLIVYLEKLIKLLIKSIIYTGEKKEIANRQLGGLKRGFHSYQKQAIYKERKQK